LRAYRPINHLCCTASVYDRRLLRRFLNTGGASDDISCQAADARPHCVWRSAAIMRAWWTKQWMDALEYLFSAKALRMAT